MAQRWWKWHMAVTQGKNCSHCQVGGGMRVEKMADDNRHHGGASWHAPPPCRKSLCFWCGAATAAAAPGRRALCPAWRSSSLPPPPPPSWPSGFLGRLSGRLEDCREAKTSHNSNTFSSNGDVLPSRLIFFSDVIFIYWCHQKTLHPGGRFQYSEAS